MGHESLTAATRAACLDQVIRALRRSALLGLPASVIMVLIVGSSVPLPARLVFVALVWLADIVCFVAAGSYLRRRACGETIEQYWLGPLSVGFIGFAWASLALIGLPDADHADLRAIYLLFVCAVSCTYVVGAAARRLYFYVSAVPLFVPVMVVFVSSPDRPTRLLGLAIPIYFAVMASMHHEVHSVVVSEIELRERHDLANEQIRSTVSLLSATLDSTADGILVVDREGAMTLWNERFAHMWQIPAAVMASRDDASTIQYVLDQLVRPDLFLAKVRELYDQPDAESHDTLDFIDGRVFERYSQPQYVDGQVVGRVWTFRDVTERVELVNQLSHQAFHDNLTGLANRALLRDRIEHALARARRSAATVAVLFCDVDRFKMVNDTMGHDCGDTLLTQIATRLVANLRDGDTAARLGGDEFAIVIEEAGADDATTLAQRLLEVLREPFVIRGEEVPVRVSIGIADTRNEVLDVDELLCRADIAMYAAKGRGRDRYESFQTAMQAELAARHEPYGDLRQALLRNELVVYYQPLIDLATKRIDSFEALVRWQHPTRGLIPPDDFIPLAEETGLIIDLGRFVLQQACRHIADWRTVAKSNELSVSVNVSSHQLYDDRFVNDVATALQDSGLPATALTLELTETALLANSDQVHDRLNALKQLGIRIAIDDFGTGYSSLAYLRAFPIDFLKIDRSFVNELNDHHDGQGEDMIRSIIGIGHNLQLEVVAEGIERPSQLSALLAAGCNTGQGYLFAKPVPADEIPELIALFVGQSTPTAVLRDPA
jgi:diguanylate cyclase (GGDEF)-like protein